MMLSRLFHALGTAYIPVSARLAVSTWIDVARPPRGPAVVHAGGGNPDRVLLLGGASAVGFGTVTHDLALAGNLARQASELTGRGIDLAVNASPSMRVSRVRAALDPVKLMTYDAAVFTIGTREAYEFMPLGIWRAQLTALLELATRSNPALRVIVVGAETDISVPMPDWIRGLGVSHAEAFNRASRVIVAEYPNVDYVDSALITGPRGSPEIAPQELYIAAARGISPALADALDDSPRRAVHTDEGARVAAVARMLEPSATEDDELEKLIVRAKGLMGAFAAALDIVGEHSVWLRASIGVPQNQLPRHDALCNDALATRDGLVVTDLAADPRYANLSFVTGAPHLRFYAGHPVFSPDGYPVAILSIFDTRPRTFRPSHTALLRQLARQAMKLLYSGEN